MSWTRFERKQTVASPVLNWGVRSILVVLVVAMVATLFLDSDAASVVMSIAIFIGLATASRLFLSRSRNLPPEERRAWVLFAIGLGLGAAGVASFAIAFLVSSDIGVFSPLDLIWLSGYALVIAGLARLPHAAGSNWQRLRLFIDGVIGAIAVGALLWTLSARDLTTQLAEGGVWERFVGSAYVLLDASVLVVLMIVLVRRSTYRFDLRLVLIGLAVVAHGVADYSFLTSGVGQSFTDAEPLYPVSIFAVTMFVAAGALIAKEPQEYEYTQRTKTPWWVLVLPYGFAVAMVIVMFVRVPVNPIASDAGGLLHATFLVFALLIGRQAVSIRENQRLVEDQRTALVSSISHELRTPLTSVVGFLDLLDGDALGDGEERDEVTAIANEQAQYLGRIVSDLVMLASDKMTTIELEVEPIAIDELVWASVNAAEIDIAHVRVDAERQGVAFLDKSRIEQAMANLLSNALLYGGENATVVARAENGDLLLEVHDDGPGVPRKYELIIWQRFERGPNRLNAVVPGSGIGLAVTEAIATAHGGSSGYRRSEQLGGACFWLRLPGRVRDGKPVGDPPVAHLTVIPDDAQTA